MLAAQIRSTGGRAVVLKADVAQQVQAAEAVERTVATMGRLDIVINNAGVMHLGPIVGAPVKEWEQMVNLNLLGFLYIANATLPHLLKAVDDSPAVSQTWSISAPLPGASHAQGQVFIT